MLVWGLALAILLSALNVFLRDIEYLVEVGILIFFWASPIVYSWSLVVQSARRTPAWPGCRAVYISQPDLDRDHGVPEGHLGRGL